MEYDPLINDYSWVYVVRKGRCKYEIGIAFHENFPLEEAIEGREIILWRRFDDLMAAVGYRMILLGLPNKELLAAVKRYNRKQKIRQQHRMMEQNNNKL